MKKGIMDMTHGNTIKQLLLFAIPMLIGNVFQQLYNMVDSIIVGKYVSSDALASVGATSSLNFFFFSFSFGMAAGVGVIVAQYMGAGDEENVKKTIANAIYVISTIAICMSIIGVVFAENILRFLNTPDAILKSAALYLRVTCAGLIAVTSYNAISAILRALGDSKTPLIFLVVSSIINVCLDLVFVLYFDMGVMGVAIATIIAQSASAVMLNGIVEVVGRVGFSKPLTMVKQIGVYGIWYTTALTWTITAIICSIRYFSGRWKNKGIIDIAGKM